MSERDISWQASAGTRHDQLSFLGKNQARAILSLLVLLKHGLTGVAELGRSLLAKELQQVCREKRLVTMHPGWGIFLSSPLHADIRVGHVALDDIRMTFSSDEEGSQAGVRLWLCKKLS